MKVKTVIEMDYGELEDIVNKYYNLSGKLKYSFVAVEECGNDSSHTFSIQKAEPLDEYNQKVIERLKEGNLSAYHNSTILQDLVNNGQLAPGEYLIEVCW